MNNRSLSRQLGFTLVELMIALVLGLLVGGAAIGVFVSNQQVNRQGEAMARMQESARYAFELMARAIRGAGGVVCGGIEPVNVLNNPSSYWWADWEGGAIRGIAGDNPNFPKSFGTNAADRVSGTDAIILLSGTANDGVYIIDHNPTAAQFKVNTIDHGIIDGDILLVCDYQHAAIFQTTNASSTNVTIVHNSGTGSPGNCTKGLGRPRVCTANGTPYTFANGGFITKLSAEGWYIGHNGRGERSLYRLRMQNSSGTPSGLAEEIAEGVTDLQIQYLARNNAGTLDTQYRDLPQDYDGNGTPDWNNVVAVRLTLTLATLEQVGTNNQPIQRNWYTLISIRNRAR
ncbi:prepilin-type N-terminal cleavage/methylation domain-containing protein [Caldichromatium japonicum]|uniref:Prepilin-type N-terminal cleavage/methylation domain-containing protein n=1 Tax=Caldichromatium japonicum TaxID=2699430 RepID=A0A6G7VGC6_9GAMM|nr:PilW family protein [Caldichromatium japonicum]QIK39044.1 prepilin-type N-terminal cleavage/methylation domain-containing protein [Caldichromatium japonicum]